MAVVMRVLRPFLLLELLLGSRHHRQIVYPLLYDHMVLHWIQRENMMMKGHHRRQRFLFVRHLHERPFPLTMMSSPIAMRFSSMFGIHLKSRIWWGGVVRVLMRVGGVGLLRAFD